MDWRQKTFEIEFAILLMLIALLLPYTYGGWLQKLEQKLKGLVPVLIVLLALSILWHIDVVSRISTYLIATTCGIIVFIGLYFARSTPWFCLSYARYAMNRRKSMDWQQVAVCSVDLAPLPPKLDKQLLRRLVVCLDSAMHNAMRCATGNVRGRIAFQLGVLNHALPRFSGVTGVSWTLIWELPDKHNPVKTPRQSAIRLGVELLLIDFAGYLQSEFDRNRRESFTEVNERALVDGIAPRISLCSGQASRMASPTTTIGWGYVGRAPQEAIRLRNELKPGSCSIGFELAGFALMERVCMKEGRWKFEPSANSNSLRAVAWQTEQQLLQRISKQDVLTDEMAAATWLTHATREQRDPTPKVPLTEDDIVSVFKLRETWEPRFASELAKMAKDTRQHLGQDGVTSLLAQINKQIECMSTMIGEKDLGKNPNWIECGEQFHSLIAERSVSEEPLRAQRRKDFAREIYRIGKPIYTYAIVAGESDAADTIKEHRDILASISAGDAAGVEAEVRHHLERHYNRAHQRLCGELE